ncbi:exporter of polyketide antibiotics [Mycolicibacterium cyprinidarum]|uniref:Exporter of polyketide antibiotics n=1 Tax=Mycolicibacterium cyprinidarum TaxID=2860311 RepID=A0ABQ4VF24_9MYCO|nr:exporter of polyketide antibiotics [Mycolicibacterium sp. NGTWS0302]GJF17426.1 exporter of polyketide antibiotics [Mycolicibacterium sp. NGTWSNA01]GJF18490.1 exporter of polyketide antibiotics [Mycolicibacterium sp. NGTWS1803]
MTAFSGVSVLLPVSLKQNAHGIAPWVIGVSSLSASSILAYRWIFPDVADRTQLSTALASNPALSLIFGPARDLMTNDGFNAWRSGALGAFFAALMAILIVVANSRADEDSGQAELLASGVVGRQARLTVAVLLAAIAAVAMGSVCFFLTVAVGGATLPSLLLSATFTASGLIFAGVAAVTVQLGSDARSASSIAIGFLGVCFVVRGSIDSIDAPGWAVWTTPLGWLEQVRPGADINPWPLLLALALAVVLIAFGFGLDGRRDYGAGIIAPRPGPARGTRAASVWGLAVRLNRGSLITWLVAFAGLGVIFGYLSTSITDLLGSNASLRGVLASQPGSASNLTFAFLVTILQLAGLIAAVSGVQIVNRIIFEENNFRVEPLLAGALRRPTYLASNIVIAYLAPAIYLLLSGTIIGLIAANFDTGVSIPSVIAQAAATVPAVWALVAVAAAAIGARPAVRLVGWLAIVAAFALTILGPTFKLPGWALAISPLHHVPDVTVPALDWTGLAGVVVGVLVLTAIAFVGFRHRDIG